MSSEISDETTGSYGHVHIVMPRPSRCAFGSFSDQVWFGIECFIFLQDVPRRSDSFRASLWCATEQDKCGGLFVDGRSVADSSKFDELLEPASADGAVERCAAMYTVSERIR